LPPDPKHLNIDKVYNLFKIDSNETAGVFKSISTFVVHSIFVHKKADKATYAPGEDVTYTILYGNVLAVDANDTVLNDTLPDVEYLGASPAPDLTDGRILTWYLGQLRSKENGTIYVFVRIKDRAGIKFEETQSVSG
jgi:uncharacterized repeat protein (TIGR01451 family)